MKSLEDTSEPLPLEQGRDSLQEVLGGFPRHLTTQLIEEGEGKRSQRELLGGVLIGLGLAGFALAFPQERLIGQQVAHLASDDTTLQVAFDAVSEYLARAFDSRPEPSRFVLAALAYGACMPAALGICRRMGCDFALSLVVSLLVLLSPVAWLAGTTPGLESFGLFFALQTLHALWGRERPAALVPTSWWVLSAACSPINAWLLPAVVWGSLQGRTMPAKRGELLFSLPLIGGVLFLLFSTHLSIYFRWDHELGQIWTALLFGGAGSWSSIWQWIVGVLPGLGICAVGLASLFLLKREESEAKPPRWLLAWCALPALAAGLAGSPTWSIPYLWLIAPALLGTADLLARRGADLAPLWHGALLVAQGAVLAAALVFVSATDPLTEWRTRARSQLDAGDHVTTARSDHAYLIANRWGLECELLMDPHELELMETRDALTVPLTASGELSDELLVLTPKQCAARALERERQGQRIVLDADFAPALEAFGQRLAQALRASVQLVVIERAASQ